MCHLLIHQSDHLQSPLRRRTLGDAVVSTDAPELALTHHVHHHADLAIQCPLWLPTWT